jgi:hypothetical protein
MMGMIRNLAVVRFLLKMRISYPDPLSLLLTGLKSIFLIQKEKDRSNYKKTILNKNTENST